MVFFLLSFFDLSHHRACGLAYGRNDWNEEPIGYKKHIGGRALERRASAADGVTVTNGLRVDLGLFTVGPAPIRMSAGGRLSRYVAITS